MTPPQKGGFYPSVMGNILITGPAFISASLIQAYRLIKNNTTRMASRKRHLSRKIRRNRRS
uniref:Uncharacterized protein n=1 Tax=viral metagenome TaxID=1070528 RepID=A0A6C0DCR6_9ZZZZ